jgi:tRNA (guanine37-N1)-methyltransferase
VGDPASVDEESFEQGLLEFPQYTRPQLWQKRDVPRELLSGNHRQISEWRKAKAEELTKQRRPDLWNQYLVTKPCTPK